MFVFRWSSTIELVLDRLTITYNYLFCFCFSYFTDGLRTIEHFGTYIEDLTVKLSGIKTQQEDERRALIDVKNCLKNSAGIHKMVSFHTYISYVKRTNILFL